MNRWTVMGTVVVAGLGLLAYLRVVANEVALQLRALTLRVEADKKREENASGDSANHPLKAKAAATQAEAEEPITAEVAA